MICTRLQSAGRAAGRAFPWVPSQRLEASQRWNPATERAGVGFLIGAHVGGGAMYVLCAGTDDCPVWNMTAAAAAIGGLLGAGFGVLADPDRQRGDT